jgi:superfamily II DNA or RNA helicase
MVPGGRVSGPANFTGFARGGQLRRFSSRQGRLAHVILKDRLAGATEYLRIAGYFRSSIFELVNEEIEAIGAVRIVCNADVDPADIKASQLARQTVLMERWNATGVELDSMLHRARYQRLYDLLRKGNVEVRVVARTDTPFLHGKAGVIRRGDGTATAFMGSLNETREGWAGNYEMVWEDTSQDGVAWVQAEFDHLWQRGVALPDAIIEEIGRSARKRQAEVAELPPAEVGPAALVEAPIYRQGEELKPWQRAFVGIFLAHRETYGKARLLLADEVGVGKTLSLAGSALVACLLGDGPALILCPATLCQQWQVELFDRLGIPSAVWLSAKKAWMDHTGHVIRTRGPEDVARCPYQVGIVSTGLIFQPNSPERAALLRRKFGTLILDEAHRARLTGGFGPDAGKPNNLLAFMLDAADSARHVVLGTATPIQTDVAELWELLEVLNRNANHVLGRIGSEWRSPGNAIPVLTGAKPVDEDEDDVWDWLRNPLPPASEDSLFDNVRKDLAVPAKEFFTSESVTKLDDFTRELLFERVREVSDGLFFLQRNNPLVRHVVLRRRSTLEEAGLLPRIAVDIWPTEGQAPAMFDGVAVRTSLEFDLAYQAAIHFTEALARRKQSAGFMRSLLLQRICSSYASGIATAQRLLDKRELPEDGGEQQEFDTDTLDLDEVERGHLRDLIGHLSAKPMDPKLEAVLHFLRERRWLDHGCIIFSQYFDTASWVARSLAATLPGVHVAVYAGADRSGIFLGEEWRSVERNAIKGAVRERQLRLVVATDAACEGLNLQTLGTLINVDLPWNPSRLEQRIGRIRRFGQARDRVDMLNLVYKDTNDEKVYTVLSKRMKDRYDLLGSLPDVIEDEWIENIENLDDYLSQFTKKRKAANTFDLRYGGTVEAGEPSWALCEKVLARRDVVDRMSRGW